MNVDSRLAALAPPFQAALRAYAFGPELERMAADVQQMLQRHRTQRAGLHDAVRLKMLSLLAEYLDAFGRAAEAALLLKPTVQELLATLPEWPAELEAASADNTLRRLHRQRVWCCLAYAVCLLRASRHEAAGSILERLHHFVTQVLADPVQFPCHGTLALLRYYQGVVNRNRGRLNEAAWDFDAAQDRIQRRFAEKIQKHGAANPDRVRREAIYRDVNLARILGFGHGGIALARGRYLEAKAWLAASQQILAQGGQEVWRRGLEVYGCCAAVLVEELTPASLPSLNAHAERLNELAAWFAGRHRRNEAVAGAFALLAEVRLRQIVHLQNGSSLWELNLDGLLRPLERYLRELARDTGPLSATAALRLVSCLLRARHYDRCERELSRFRQVFGEQAEGWAEYQVVQAELWVQTGRLEAARARLLELAAQRPANRAYRARAWALLAWCELRSGQPVWAARSLAAAREAVAHVQDGFTRVLVDEVARRIDPPEPSPARPMPYQQAVDDARWCDLEHNLEMARLHVVEAVHQRHPGYGVEKVAALLGRGPSWLYAFLARHRGVPWVQSWLNTNPANLPSRGRFTG